jgi:hypothetical protein
MRFSSVPTVALLAAVLGGCSDPVLPESETRGEVVLAGRWIGARDGLSPQGSHQQELTFAPFGRFVSEHGTFGVYEGQQRDALSAFVRFEGTYRVEGDRLYFQPQRHIWWDRFYGADSPVNARPTSESIFDDARFSVRGNTLTLYFTVAPADAPIPVSAQYTRVRARQYPFDFD